MSKASREVPSPGKYVRRPHVALVASAAVTLTTALAASSALAQPAPAVAVGVPPLQGAPPAPRAGALPPSSPSWSTLPPLPTPPPSSAARTPALAAGHADTPIEVELTPPRGPTATPVTPLTPPESTAALTPPTPAPPALAPPALVAMSPPPAAPKAEAAKPAHKPAHWYDKIKLRGYSQLRYNRLFASNDDYVNVQGDKTIGKLNGFSLRRARLIVSGDVHERVSVYLQTDAATAVDNLTHVVTMRDWYADIFLDERKEARLRVGQSKVPYGFENMQSSQNRVPLDRSDAINTGAPNERDIGAFFYWAPAEVRARFKHLVDAGLKGSGDYGLVGVGLYNGQSSNLKEQNDNLHAVARATYPFAIGDQILEIGGGGYTGKYVVTKSEGVGGPAEFRDARAEAAVVLYPQPFGFQAEYNIGVGPELDASRGVVREGRAYGGYAMVMLRTGDFLPYVRASFYKGGKKHETDALKYDVREVEAGVEWRIFDALELTAAYVQGSRTSPKAPYTQESGRLVRLQLQFNY